MIPVIHSLPPDPTLPPEIGDASAWYGPELKGRTDWIEHVSEAEIAELESTARELAKSSIDLSSIAAEDFRFLRWAQAFGYYWKRCSAAAASC